MAHYCASQTGPQALERLAAPCAHASTPRLAAAPPTLKAVFGHQSRRTPSFHGVAEAPSHRRRARVHAAEAGAAAPAVATAPAVAAPPVGAAPPAVAAPPLPAAPLTQLVYSGVVFDMDGTLAVSKIDYKTMRQKTGIPVGDLFTVMERCGTRVGCSCQQEPLLPKSRDSTATTHVSFLPHLCYSWDDGDRIKASMDTILELEAQASASLEAMPGLLSLLAFLRASGIKVGLITRNTTESLNAFFAGELRAA